MIDKEKLRENATVLVEIRNEMVRNGFSPNEAIRILEIAANNAKVEAIDNLTNQLSQGLSILRY